MTYDVLVYGPIFCDLIFTDLPKLPVLGEELYAGDLTVTIGGSAIVTAGLRQLGARVGLIADVGNDPLSQVVSRILDDLGLDRALVRAHPYPLAQVTVALSFPTDRAFVTCFRPPRTTIDLAMVVRAQRARHLHVCSLLAALQTPNVCQIAHAAGLTVSLDPGWDEIALRDSRLAAMIAELDLFMPNEKELCHLVGVDDVPSAAAQVLATMPRGTLVLKQGAAGATAFSSANATPIHVAALPITPVDTTGAGDAFDAGFLWRYIQGAPLDDCMRMGSVCGGLATTARGGIDALPTLAEAEAWLAKLPS
jgi:sugar/nucleoside kinase (ribokinase family)